MNRTWKDAACEVAWNKFRKTSHAGFNVKAFLRGNMICTGNFVVPSESIIIIGGCASTTFRAAFMKWLDENEVKK
jgi:hypothetical protein